MQKWFSCDVIFHRQMHSRRISSGRGSYHMTDTYWCEGWNGPLWKLGNGSPMTSKQMAKGLWQKRGVVQTAWCQKGQCYFMYCDIVLWNVQTAFNGNRFFIYFQTECCLVFSQCIMFCWTWWSDMITLAKQYRYYNLLKDGLWSAALLIHHILTIHESMLSSQYTGRSI